MAPAKKSGRKVPAKKSTKRKTGAKKAAPKRRTVTVKRTKCRKTAKKIAVKKGAKPPTDGSLRTWHITNICAMGKGKILRPTDIAKGGGKYHAKTAGAAALKAFRRIVRKAGGRIGTSYKFTIQEGVRAATPPKTYIGKRMKLPADKIKTRTFPNGNEFVIDYKDVVHLVRTK